MKKKAKNNGDASVSRWFSGRRLQFLLLVAGAAIVAYKIGQYRERKKMQARLNRIPKGQTLQQKMGVPMAPAPRRDNMGFSDVESDLSGCGNKPAAACTEIGGEFPSIAQADVPSEEFEFTN